MSRQERRNLDSAAAGIAAEGVGVFLRNQDLKRQRNTSPFIHKVVLEENEDKRKFNEVELSHKRFKIDMDKKEMQMELLNKRFKQLEYLRNYYVSTQNETYINNINKEMGIVTQHILSGTYPDEETFISPTNFVFTSPVTPQLGTSPTMNVEDIVLL